MGVKTVLFALGVLLCKVSEAYTCQYLDNAPVIEASIPSLQHTLKFLNIDATVYRHTLAEGSLPRLRILQYSSTPVIDVISSGSEVVISMEGDSCKSGGYLSKAPSSSIFVTGLLLASASTHFRNLGVTAMMSLGLLAFKMDTVEAAETDKCTPSMSVVLEAPPYYLGSVDECLAEVSNAGHCPEPFPTFKTCSDPSPSCKLAVVGAGTGGLYTAMRLVEENKFDAEDVCIFEATERVGGRIYSLRGFGPENDITVDAGGYRTWPEFTVSNHIRFISPANAICAHLPICITSQPPTLLSQRNLDFKWTVTMKRFLVRYSTSLGRTARRQALPLLLKR